MEVSNDLKKYLAENPEYMVCYFVARLPSDFIEKMAKWYSQNEGVDYDECLKSCIKNGLHEMYSFNLGQPRIFKIVSYAKALDKSQICVEVQDNDWAIPLDILEH